MKRAAGHTKAEDGEQRLTVLNTLLKKAVEWGLIETMPCTIKAVTCRRSGGRVPRFRGYERLVEAARSRAGEVS